MQQITDLFIQPYTPMKTLLRWIRLNTSHILKNTTITTFGRLATLMVKFPWGFCFFDQIRVSIPFSLTPKIHEVPS